MPVAGALCTSSLGWPAVYYIHAVVTFGLFVLFYFFYRYHLRFYHLLLFLFQREPSPSRIRQFKRTREDSERQGRQQASASAHQGNPHRPSHSVRLDLGYRQLHGHPADNAVLADLPQQSHGISSRADRDLLCHPADCHFLPETSRRILC